MITIKKDSLLFRLAMYGAGSPFEFYDYNVETENLCPFMRQVFMGIIVCSCLAVIVAAFIFSGIGTVIDFMYPWIPAKPNIFFAIFMSIGWVVWLFAGVVSISGIFVGTLIGIAWIIRKIKALFFSNEKAEHTLNIIEQYIEAKHHKFCPPIKIIE